MPAMMVIGDVLYDLFGEVGKNLVETAHFTPKMGGAPANLAVSAAKIGGDVGFVGKVGRDEFGSHLKSFMAGQGVDVTHLTLDPHLPTMIGLVALPTPETPQFILIPGASAALSKADIPAELIETTRLLAFGGVNLAWDCAEATLYAAQTARRAGKIVVFDVNLRPAIWPSPDTARQKLLAASMYADIIKLNLEEGQFLFGARTAEAIAQAVLARGAKLVCLSLGGQGSQFFTQQASVTHPGFPIKVMDATGAGDAFSAGICVFLCEYPGTIEAMTAADLTELAAFANGCGALVATRLGAMEATFSRADVQHLISSNCLNNKG